MLLFDADQGEAVLAIARYLPHNDKRILLQGLAAGKKKM
jgi:hypothetical protein